MRTSSRNNHPTLRAALAQKQSVKDANRALTRERIAVLLRKGEPSVVIRRKLGASEDLVAAVAAELNITPPRLCDWEAA